MYAVNSTKQSFFQEICNRKRQISNTCNAIIDLYNVFWFKCILCSLALYTREDNEAKVLSIK